jgi:hypothetical protein
MLSVRARRSRLRLYRGEPGPGADVAGGEPGPGADVARGEPGPGADVAGAEFSPGADVARVSLGSVPAQMRQG